MVFLCACMCVMNAYEYTRFYIYKYLLTFLFKDNCVKLSVFIAMLVAWFLYFLVNAKCYIVIEDDWIAVCFGDSCSITTN